MALHLRMVEWPRGMPVLVEEHVDTRAVVARTFPCTLGGSRVPEMTLAVERIEDVGVPESTLVVVLTEVQAVVLTEVQAVVQEVVREMILEEGTLEPTRISLQESLWKVL
jgi:hypothetical protein